MSMPQTTAATNGCPCGSEKTIELCCLPLIQGKQKAKTAESLMRARYTAFTRGDVDFIMSTHHTRTLKDVKRDDVEEWSKNSEWLGLKVHQTQEGQPDDEKGTIVFHAQYRADGKVNDHWEHSIFEKEEGEWRFLDAQGIQQGPIRRTEPKIGRNDPCGCGSGKKLKKCCG